MDFNVLLLLFSIITTIILMKKNVNIGIVMLINSVFVIISYKMDIPTIISSVQAGLFGSKTVNLVLLLTLIMIIENIMRNSGMIKQMSDNLKLYINNNFLRATLMPIVLGLLPSPGGARFSCPMVEEILGTKLSNENKAYLNYWFRHVWMDGFILYPGIIIVSELTGIPLISLFLHLAPFMLIAFISGAILLANKMPQTSTQSNSDKFSAIKNFSIAFFPILLLIVLYMLINSSNLILFSLSFSKYALFLSGLITVIYLVIYNKYSVKSSLDAIKASFNPKYVTIIVGVMIFNEFITRSKFTNHFIDTIVYHHIPKELLIILIPFIASLLSGITVSAMSISIPLLMPFGISTDPWLTTMAFTSGFFGQMITPLHLCCTMSCDYFKVSMNTVTSKIFHTLCIMGVFASILLFITLKYK